MTKFYAQKLLFDLDGTLVDTAADLHAATNHALSSIGRKTVALDQVRDMTGYGALKLIERGLEGTGGTDNMDISSLHRTFLAYYRNHICEHSRLYPGCIPMLEELKEAKFQLAVCTNKPIDMAIPLLEDIGIAPFFSAITGGDSFSYKKPDGRHLTSTSAMLAGVDKTVMIGDSKPDIAAAKAAGYPAIAVDYGYSQVSVDQLEPDHIVSSLSEIPSKLAFAHS